MNHWQSGYTDANGIRIHYHRTGGDKPPLVLLHGITDNGLCWGRLARVLEADYDVVMVDARGHGLSDKPESGYTSDDYAADIAGLIESLDLGPAIVMGHSLGAVTAATVAAGHPHRVTGAVLEDPPWYDESDPQTMMSPEQVAEWMAGWRADLIAQQQLSEDEIIAAGREQSPRWRADEFPAWAQAKLQVSPDVLSLNQMRTWRELTPRFQRPVLLITGDREQGAIVTPGLAAKILAANARVEHVHIPNVGHNIHRQEFDAYVNAVRAFLAEI